MIERGFNLCEQWRGLEPLRHSSHRNYGGGALRREIVIWTAEVSP